MSDNKDVVQRGDDKVVEAKSTGVVDLGHRAPKQDLWDIDDDIFKPLLDKIEQERREEELADAANRATEQAEKLISGDNYYAPPNTQTIQNPQSDHGRKPQHQSASQRKPVLDKFTPGPVTIRSQKTNMPRVIWRQRKSAVKSAIAFFENLNRRGQLLCAGLALFIVWNAVLIFAARTASLALFQFDPFYPNNWVMVYDLYDKGSTLQWGFVAYYLAVAVLTTIVGLAVSIKNAPKLRPIAAGLFKFVFLIPKGMILAMLAVLGFRKSAPAFVPAAAPIYAGGRGNHYHGASFKIDKNEEDETPGGSVAGGGAGGGHGKPSWQGGPANTQAFPRSEQGRR